MQVVWWICGVGHGTPDGTPDIKKVHFSSTPQPLGGVLLVVHPMYSRTRSGLLVGVGRYQIFADTPICRYWPMPICRHCRYRYCWKEYLQLFLIADTDAADTEKCADISDIDTSIGPSLAVGLLRWESSWSIIYDVIRLILDLDVQYFVIWDTFHDKERHCKYFLKILRGSWVLLKMLFGFAALDRTIFGNFCLH